MVQHRNIERLLRPELRFVIAVLSRHEDGPEALDGVFPSEFYLRILSADDAERSWYREDRVHVMLAYYPGINQNRHRGPSVNRGTKFWEFWDCSF